MEAKIRDTMDTYREQIDAAVSVIKTSMLTEFDDLHIPKFEAKTVGSNVPAREQWWMLLCRWLTLCAMHFV